MSDCIFCKIVAGDLPSIKLYEDDHFISIVDIMPFSKGHILLLPKQHSESVMDMSDEESRLMLPVAKMLAKAVVQAVSADGFNLLTNVGKAAQQQVFHTHLHIIPRFTGEPNLLSNPSPYNYSGDDEKLEMVEAIKSFQS